MADTPLISVVIPCYQAADTLPETLATVFSQDYPHVEVVAVDDGSTDDTTNILAGYGDRLITQRIPNSGGPSRPRNVGVEHATGEYVAFFDSDDLMLPGKLKAQAAVLADRPEVDFVFTDFRMIDPEGAVLTERFLDTYRNFRNHCSKTDQPDLSRLDGAHAYHELIRANFIGTSSVMVRRDKLVAAGGFDETLHNGDDIDMWLKLARTGAAFAFLDRPYHDYRKVPGGISARGWRRLPSAIRVRERQRPHVTDPETLTILDRALHRMHLAHAWGLRGEGRFAEALPVYREVVARHWTWSGFKGLMLTRLQLLFSRTR